MIALTKGANNGWKVSAITYNFLGVWLNAVSTSLETTETTISKQNQQSLMKTLTLTAVLLAGFSVAGPVAADTRQQLLRCDDINLEDGPYGQYYGMDFYGTDEVCGGDTLDKGSIGVFANRFIRVRLDNANTDPFVLYEVYYVSIGDDPATDKTMVGNLMTDCNGDANGVLKDMTRPIDIVAGSPVNIKVRVGDENAGFFFYSRGPYGYTDDGSCRPTIFNTSDGTRHGTFNNPSLWGGWHGV